MEASNSRPAYRRRIVDDELDEIMPDLAAIALEGPKGVGKTATALQRAASTWRLDDAGPLAEVRLDAHVVTRTERPTLIDEWQQHPPTWDVVRRAVDDHAPGGSFLLTGSLIPRVGPAHSGAGRIAVVRMRPLSLNERELADAVVSLGSLLRRERPDPRGIRSEIRLADYVDEILSSGFPGIRPLGERARRVQLDSFVERMVGREQGLFESTVRHPATMRGWLRAYAAATSTTTSWEKIRTAATSGDGDSVPAKATALAYRELLERAWLLDEVPAWFPTRNRLKRLTYPPKHQLADPALAARLLGIERTTLLGEFSKGVAPDSRLLGQLFESLVTMSVLTYAQSAEARVSHLRTGSGEHEVDLIVEGSGGRVVAIEVKLVGQPRDEDVKHLNWLERQIGDDLVDKVIITAGQLAYRRDDGVLVVPAALLGP
jgi:uncharacterized protein